MKAYSIVLAVAFFLPVPVGQSAGEAAKAESVRLEFKIAKQRTKRDKKGGSSNSTTSETWNYKVEVENRSLDDIGALEVKYTYYISTETRSGGSRKETTRKVSGEGSIRSIPRGNRAIIETKASALKQSEKTERKKSNNKGGNNKKKQNKNTQIKVTEVREKLDGISVEVFHKGKRVGEYVVGDAAKRAAAKRKR